MMPHPGLASDTSTAVDLDMDDLPASQPATSRDPAPAALQPTLMDPPEPLSIHDDDNPDAMALRAAISVLQLQKDKARRDLHSLQLLKKAAAERLEPFLHQLLSGKLQPTPPSEDPLHATLDSDDDRNDDAGKSELTPDKADDGDAAAEAEGLTTFPKLPAMQSIFRCPPINWAKYHVIGEALDKMHEEQLRRPGPSATTHSIAAPYSPFTDQPRDQVMPQPAIFPP